MSSSKEPTLEDLALASALIRSGPAPRSRFFNGLRNPRWARPLMEAGAFDNVPSDGSSDESRSGNASWWPAGSYLVRVAKENIEVIHDVMQRRKLKNNLHVRAALIVAIGTLEASDISRFVPKLIEWAKDIKLIQDGGLHLTAIVRKLLSGEQTTDAMNLAKEMWGLHAPDKQNLDGARTFDHGEYPHSTSAMSESDFVESIRAVSIDMVREQPCGALDIFRRVLTDCIMIERGWRESDQNVDYSFSWRHSVEHQLQDDPVTWRDVLVDAVRDSAVECCKRIGSTSEALEEVVSKLQPRSSSIFQRVALYVCGQFPSEFCTSSILVPQSFTPELLQSPYVHHEQRILVRTALPMLNADQKAMLISNWRVAFGLRNDSDMNGEVGSELIWWFSGVEEHLPAPFFQQFNEAQMVTLNIQPNYRPFVSRWKDEVPNQYASFSANEIAAMPVRGIIGALQEWQPSGHPLDATPKSLSDAIEEMDVSKVLELLSFLPDCANLDATYWAGILRGVQNCVQKTAIDEAQWRKVVKFVRTICVESILRSTDVDTQLYTHPQVSQRYALDLLRYALKRDYLSVSMMPDVWEAIDVLMSNTEPVGDTHSPNELFGLTLNSVFGVSHHCAIDFAQSVYRLLDCKKKEGPSFLELTGGVWGRFTEHLENPTFSDSVRAICGGWIPVLHSLNEYWVLQNCESIFPHGENEYDRWSMAWVPYVMYCHPHKRIVELMLPEYQHALDVRDRGSGIVEVTQWWWRYIEHICVMSVTGELDEVPDGVALWDRFVKECEEMSLHKAIGFIGRGLAHGESTYLEETLPTDTVERAKRIWSGILNQLESEHDGSVRRRAASAFGWWVSAKVIDSSWMLSNLVKATECAGRVDDLSMVLKVLADDDDHAGDVGNYSNLLLQFVLNIVQGLTLGELMPEDAQNIRRIFMKMGRQANDEQQLDMKTCLKHLTELDNEIFEPLYRRLCD